MNETILEDGTVIYTDKEPPSVNQSIDTLAWMMGDMVNLTLIKGGKYRE